MSEYVFLLMVSISRAVKGEKKNTSIRSFYIKIERTMGYSDAKNKRIREKSNVEPQEASSHF